MDLEREFADFIRKAGLDARTVIMDGRWHNIPLIGQRNGKTGGYCGWLDDSPHGYTHNHRTGEHLHWTPDTGYIPLSPAEERRLAAERQRRAAAQARERREIQAEKAELARSLWGRADVAKADHPYLLSKKIGSHDVRQLRDTLLIALTDPLTDEIWNLQFIAPDRKKRPLAGARKRGLVHIFGAITNRFTISEGAATAISVYEALDVPAVMAIDSGNLPFAGRALHQRYPEAAILVCGDNDAKLPLQGLPNVGKEKAEYVVRQIRAQVSLPGALDVSRDWNDVYVDCGPQETARQIRTNRREPG